MKEKFILKMVASLLFIVSFFVMTSCEGTPVYEQKMIDENGVWECQYILYSKTECAVGDWTTEYKQTHEYLPYVFIPSHINGVKVVQYGYSAGMSTKYFLGARGKIFIPYTIKDLRRTNNSQFMLSSNGVQNLLQGEYYVANIYYDEYLSNIKKGIPLYKANVVYDINYSNEEYKYHSVDNYEYGSLIEIIPPQPEREGYTFDGWYKEPECINAWNFETDTLPELKLDAGGNEIFQETALYAKWI